MQIKKQIEKPYFAPAILYIQLLTMSATTSANQQDRVLDIIDPFMNCIAKFIKKQQKLEADNNDIKTKKFLLISHIPQSSLAVPLS